MTPLGLSEVEIIASLMRYLGLLQSLVGAAQGYSQRSTDAGLAAALDDLYFALDVDIATRSSVSEQSVMSQLEAQHFLPLLERLWQHLSPLKSVQPSPAWIRPLRAAKAEIGMLLGHFKAA